MKGASSRGLALSAAAKPFGLDAEPATSAPPAVSLPGPKPSLSEPARALLALCRDETLAGHENVARFLEAVAHPETLARELHPLADRAARAAVLGSLASLMLALAAAWTYFRHASLWVALPACLCALAALVFTRRLSARQGLLDNATTLPLPLPQSGPMSRETVQQLVKDVQPTPDFALASSTKPLCQAHLAWARALAREHRRSGR